jgi:hypothetical protein
MHFTWQTFVHAASALALTLSAQAGPKWPLPNGVKSIEVNGYEMAY